MTCDLLGGRVCHRQLQEVLNVQDLETLPHCLWERSTEQRTDINQVYTERDVNEVYLERDFDEVYLEK